MSLEDIGENVIEKRRVWFEKIPARLVLYLLSLNGITVTFMMRIVFNLTILAMVKNHPEGTSFNVTETVCYIDDNNTYVAPIDYGGTLDWSLDHQFYILTTFYWTYLFSQPIGGILTQKYGTKRVFGWSMFVSSACVLCIPFISYIHYIIVVFLQSIHGFVQGLTWPALYAVIGVWIPIQERSRFVTCFQGLSLGTMLGNGMAGFIIAKLGWVYVFYLTGSIGIVSTLLWYLLMHDKPEQHPRITRKELRYIQDNREQCLNTKETVPWKSILTSIPVLSIGISAFGRMWMGSMLTVYGPLYLKTIIGLTVQMNGLILGISSFIAFLSAFFFSYISDKLVVYNLMPLVYNRKMFTGIGQVIPGILAIVLSYVNCNIPLIITIWFLIQLFLTAGFPGNMTNIVDISPSFTGPVTSVVQVILLQATILSPLVAKAYLRNVSTLEGWQKIFYTGSGVLIVTCIFYSIFASAKVQSWDLGKNSKIVSDYKSRKKLCEHSQLSFIQNQSK
ncbi:hypothetical protein FQR65_LT05446 [Abscondita terminalis]|nr:hypothetical protein FQR65_LT05446 [Abscondita terminalis]